MSKNKHHFLNEASLARKAIIELNNFKKEASNTNKSINFYLGQNNLFSNISVEKNFLHQSMIKSIDEIYNFTNTGLEKQWINLHLISFKHFLPDMLPHHIHLVLSLYCSLLKNTDLTIYRLPEVISEDECNIARSIINKSTEKSKKTFNNIGEDHKKEFEISSLENRLPFKKSA